MTLSYSIGFSQSGLVQSVATGQSPLCPSTTDSSAGDENMVKDGKDLTIVQDATPFVSGSCRIFEHRLTNHAIPRLLPLQCPLRRAFLAGSTTAHAPTTRHLRRRSTTRCRVTLRRTASVARSATRRASRSLRRVSRKVWESGRVGSLCNCNCCACLRGTKMWRAYKDAHVSREGRRQL